MTARTPPPVSSHPPATRGRRVAFSLALLVLAPSPGSAASLGDAVTAALAIDQQQPRVAALRGEGAAVRRQAAAPIAANPALRSKYDTETLSGKPGAYDLEAVVDLPLWLPGQRGARRAIATALDRQADTLSRQLRWEMAGRVREAIWTTALAQGRLRQTAAALESARSLERDIAKRSGAGELARVALLMAQQDTVAREADLQAAQLDYDRAIQTYVHLTGLSSLPDPLVEPPPEPPQAPALDSPTVPADHPLLAGSQGAVAQARAERERVQTDRLGHPILSLGGRRVQQPGIPTADALQVEINVPIGLASQWGPAVAGAERAYTEQVTARQRVLLEVELALKTARLDVLGAAEALTVARRRQSVTQDALRLVRRAFDLGESELIALLQAQERARQASLDLETRRLEQGRAAARLNQALGIVPN